VQVTIPFACVHVATELVTEMNVAFSGRIFVRRMEWAVEGPLFVMCNV
jgi:hypothetical protein